MESGIFLKVFAYLGDYKILLGISVVAAIFLIRRDLNRGDNLDRPVPRVRNYSSRNNDLEGNSERIES